MGNGLFYMHTQEVCLLMTSKLRTELTHSPAVLDENQNTLKLVFMTALLRA